jgi:hypothetical protein
LGAINDTEKKISDGKQALHYELRRYPFRPDEVVRLEGDVEAYEKGLEKLRKMLSELF